jgi:DnaJ-class molecular chaperone
MLNEETRILVEISCDTCQGGFVRDEPTIRGCGKCAATGKLRSSVSLQELLNYLTVRPESAIMAEQPTEGDS